jgi:hypothetical protein
MVTPEELVVPAPSQVARPGLTLASGVLAAGACVGLLIVGNEIRVWKWSRLADDLLVLLEVALGTAGIHRMMVGAAALAGYRIVGLQNRPLLSSSFSEFWSRRWNHVVQGNLDRGFFRPYGRRRRWALGTAAAFGAAAVMHVIAVLDTDRMAITLGPAAAVTAFFALHAGLVIGERRLGLHRAPQQAAALRRARIRTVALFALLSPLLLDPFACVVHVHGRTLGGSEATAEPPSPNHHGAIMPTMPFPIFLMAGMKSSLQMLSNTALGPKDRSSCAIRTPGSA